MTRPYLTIDQVVEKLRGWRPPCAPKKPVDRKSMRKHRYTVESDRRVLRRALDVLRSARKNPEAARRLVDALGGRADVTPGLLTEARQIVCRDTSTDLGSERQT